MIDLDNMDLLNRLALENTHPNVPHTLEIKLLDGIDKFLSEASRKVLNRTAYSTAEEVILGIKKISKKGVESTTVKRHCYFVKYLCFTAEDLSEKNIEKFAKVINFLSENRLIGYLKPKNQAKLEIISPQFKDNPICGTLMAPFSMQRPDGKFFLMFYVGSDYSDAQLNKALKIKGFLNEGSEPKVNLEKLDLVKKGLSNV